MNQRGHSPFVRVRLPHSALATAWSLIILCIGCVRGAHGIHPGVPSEQELIGPKVTILPAGTPVHVRLLKTLNTHKSGVFENVPFQVMSNVRVGDFTVIERGTNAIGRAYITSPDFLRRKAQIYLVLGNHAAHFWTASAVRAVMLPWEMVPRLKRLSQRTLP